MVYQDPMLDYLEASEGPCEICGGTNWASERDSIVVFCNDERCTVLEYETCQTCGINRWLPYEGPPLPPLPIHPEDDLPYEPPGGEAKAPNTKTTPVISQSGSGAQAFFNGAAPLFKGFLVISMIWAVVSMFIRLAS